MPRIGRIAAIAAIVTVLVAGIATPASADSGTPTVALTVNSLARQGVGVNWNVSVTMTGYTGPGQVCDPMAFSSCTVAVDVRYAADHSVHSVQPDSDIRGHTDPYTFNDSGSNALPTIDAIRARMNGTREIDTPWTLWTDPYPAQSASVAVNSLGRNSDGTLGYDFSLHAAGHRTGGGVCNGYWTSTCHLQVQATYASDHSVHQLTDTDIASLGDPANTRIVGSVSTPTISAIRAVLTAENSNVTDYDAPWIPLIGEHAVALTPQELAGGSNPAEKPCQCQNVDPVNTATGEFFETMTDIGLPGAGPGLELARTYSSTFAAVDGPLGYGWSTNLNAHLVNVSASAVTVSQENGSTVNFTQAPDGTFVAPPRVMATLTYDNATSSWTYTRRQSEVLKFDSNGLLMATQDLHGNAVTVTRDSAGNINQASASGGRTLTLTWAGGHIVKVTDSANRSVKYGYDDDGNLTTVTAVDGTQTTYSYKMHYLTTIKSPGGKVTSNSYDVSNRVASQTDPIGRVTTFTYSPTSSSTTTTAPDGTKTFDIYSGGVVISRTLGYGTNLAQTTNFAYDSAINLISQTDSLGKTTQFTYDGNGNQLTKTDPLGHVTTMTYDALNDVTSVTDPLSRVTRFGFDSAGDLISSTSPSGRTQSWAFNTDGTISSWTDARGKVTSYSYDGAGRRTGQVDPDGHAVGTGYNAAGQVTSTTDAAGKTTTFSLDGVGRVLSTADPLNHTTTFTYDADGNRLSTTDPNGHTSSAAYDLAGQVTSKTDANGKTSTFAYTAAGYLATVTDPDSHATTYAYNVLGQVTSTTDANGHATTFGYDADGRKVSTTLPSGAVTTVGYDDAGQVTTVTDANGKVTHNVYDAAGELTSSTDPLSRVTQRSYTGDGQLSTLTLADGSTEGYVYDGNGKTTSFTNADGKQTTYAYDDAGLLTQKTEPGGLTTSYSYDPAGRLATTTNPDLTTVTDSYDDTGHLTRVHYSNGSIDTTYAYDADGQRTGMTDSTGTSTTSYDNVGHVTSTTNGAGVSVGYGYDPAGLMTSLTYPGSRTVSYGYDQTGQMTSLIDWNSNTTSFAWTSNGQLATQSDPNGVTENRSYDPAGQATTIATTTTSGPLASYSYGYDAAGNITSDATTDPATTIAHTYGYDPLSQLGTVSTGSTAGTYTATSGSQLTGTAAGDTLGYNTAQEITSRTPTTGPATSYNYDGNGSRTSSTLAATATAAAATTSYGYSPAGNLATVTLPGTTPTQVDYTTNGEGLRQTRNDGTTTSAFLWDTSSKIPLLLDDGTHTYLYGPSSTPIAQINDTSHTIEYLHSDLLGSVRLITDTSGAVTATNEYDPYGNRTTHTGTSDSQIGYTGNWTDPATGLIYLRARDYDPTSGQFLTIDPLVDYTHQPYAYTANNPLANVDPSGLRSQTAVGGQDGPIILAPGPSCGPAPQAIGAQFPAWGRDLQGSALIIENIGNAIGQLGDVVDFAGFPEIGLVGNAIAESAVIEGGASDCIAGVMGAGWNPCAQDGLGILTDDLGGRELTAGGLTHQEVSFTMDVYHDALNIVGGWLKS